jgi:hypothetical protein
MHRRLETHRFRLVPGWRAVLRYAWSVRLNLLAMAFIAAETALPLIEKLIVIRPFTFLWLALIASVGAFWARFIRQRPLSGGDQ